MRSVEEIYEGMLASFQERTGFAPEEGCDLAVRLWAAAAEIQALEIQSDWVLNQCFPQTAQGAYLDRHGMVRGLHRVPAVRAAGTLRFSVEAPPAMDMIIQKGTVCMTEGEVRFQTTEEAVLKAGTTQANAPAEAVEPGTGGNAVPGSIRYLTACPVAITAVTNPNAFTGGCGEEDDETFRARILESYLRLPNGANTAWYETTAMAHPGVTAARAVGRARGIGTVDVYITGESGLPSQELLEELQAEIQEKREIAVDVEVKAPTAQAVNVSVAVLSRETADGAAVLAAVEQAITDFFGGRLLGRAVLLAELGDRVYQVDGVENYRFSAPAADLTADSTVLPVLGTLTVSGMEDESDD